MHAFGSAGGMMSMLRFASRKFDEFEASYLVPRAMQIINAADAQLTL